MKKVGLALGVIAALGIAGAAGSVLLIGGKGSDVGSGPAKVEGVCSSKQCLETARMGALTEDIGRCGATFEECAGYTSSGMLAVCSGCQQKGKLCPFCGTSLDPSIPRPPSADPKPVWPPRAAPEKPIPAPTAKPEPRQPSAENGAYCAPCQKETGGILTKSTGNCGVCGETTNSGMLAACFSCARKQNTCALCSHPLKR